MKPSSKVLVTLAAILYSAYFCLGVYGAWDFEDFSEVFFGFIFTMLLFSGVGASIPSVLLAIVGLKESSKVWVRKCCAAVIAWACLGIIATILAFSSTKVHIFFERMVGFSLMPLLAIISGFMVLPFAIVALVFALKDRR